jgi:Asp-tRNA(Asn)/Glu-tRNA(Gln) amidotransferase A subunit family amidase
MCQGQTARHSFASRAQDFVSGETSPSVLLEQHLQSIADNERRVRAFVHLNVARAREEAARSTERWRRGGNLSPLDGMVVAAKDIIETADMPTGQGSPMWTDFHTRRDAASIQALREAGAIILGKTTTTEFATTELLASTTNPNDPARTPGGSSSGSAAAVGAGFAPIALGSQVVGSTIRPSSYCGCVGFKPTFGALNRSGTYDHLSHSCMGIIGTHLDDVWLTAKAIATRVGGDPGHPGLTGPDTLPGAVAPRRLVMLETDGWRKASPAARSALEGQAALLRRQGVEIVRRADDPAVEAFERLLAEDLLDLSWQIMAWEFRWPLGGYASSRASQLSRAMLQRLQQGAAMTQQDYAAALARRSALRSAFHELMASFDGAITLAATSAAPLGFANTGHAGFNVPASLLGAPALSLPVLRDEGLPLGLQVIGHAGGDARLFATAGGILAAH